MNVTATSYYGAQDNYNGLGLRFRWPSPYDLSVVERLVRLKKTPRKLSRRPPESNVLCVGVLAPTHFFRTSKQAQPSSCACFVFCCCSVPSRSGCWSRVAVSVLCSIPVGSDSGRCRCREPGARQPQKFTAIRKVLCGVNHQRNRCTTGVVRRVPSHFVPFRPGAVVLSRSVAFSV